MARRTALHAVTWLVWAVAAAATAQLAPSPVYVALVVGVAAVVVRRHAPATPLARAFPLLVAVGIVFALLRVVLTALTTPGTGDLLLTLPSFRVPALLGGFRVGGDIGTAVVVRTAAEGFVIVGLMAVFGAFNAVVPHHELLQAAPRAFHEPGLVLTVALAFVPSTIASVQAVREADRARTGGRPVRRGRVLRQVLPVVETGMERAIALAESMDARGFGHLGPSPREREGGWLGLASLLCLGGAFAALVGRAPRTALALGLVGAVLLAGAVLVLSRSSRRTRYRRRRLTRLDVGVALSALAAPAAVAVLGGFGDGSLRWVGEPLAFPPFHLSVAAAIALLAVPALTATPPAHDVVDERVPTGAGAGALRASSEAS